MSGTFKAPKRSPCARLPKMSKPKRAPSQPQHKVKTKSPEPIVESVGNPQTYCRNRGVAKTSGGDGVHIQNAEISELNGWYRKRESTVRPANAKAQNLSEWRLWSKDRQWYRKDDGCYIVWFDGGPYACGWKLRNADGENRYVKFCRRGSFPAGQQWQFWEPRAESKLVARTS